MYYVIYKEPVGLHSFYSDQAGDTANSGLKTRINWVNRLKLGWNENVNEIPSYTVSLRRRLDTANLYEVQTDYICNKKKKKSYMQFKCEQQITKTAEVDLPKSIDRIHQQFFFVLFSLSEREFHFLTTNLLNLV